MLEKDLILFIVAQLATAAGVYAAIRADLREALVRIRILEKINEMRSNHENTFVHSKIS